ncbi:MAG: hypothetical protein WDA08_02275 [Weeksellaceae bacterium]
MKNSSNDKNMKNFNLGEVYISDGISTTIHSEPKFGVHVQFFLDRHKQCDWGDMAEEDLLANDDALENEGRLFSSYMLVDELKEVSGESKVWIITEWDRNYTTILFPSEY